MRHGTAPAWVTGSQLVPGRPCELSGPYREIYQQGALADVFQNNRNSWLCVPSVRRGDSYDGYAVTASTKSSSSSSSTGANVESGLVDSVIGLRLPYDDDGMARAAGSRDSV